MKAGRSSSSFSRTLTRRTDDIGQLVMGTIIATRIPPKSLAEYRTILLATRPGVTASLELAIPETVESQRH